MRLRYGILAVAVGCGGKAAAPKDVSNVTEEVSPDGVRHASYDDCPDGALEALAPGWEELDEWTEPGLDTCVRGRFPAEGVLVYASSPPIDPESQTEAPWPARRVVLVGGKVTLEGPPDGGDWMSDPASPIGAVDLDGDGTDEVLETTVLEAGTNTLGMNVLAIRDGALVVLSTIITEIDEYEEYTCKGTWKVEAGALVLTYEETGAREVNEYNPPTHECPGAGVHHFRIDDDGALVDDFAPPEDTEDGEEEEES